MADPGGVHWVPWNPSFIKGCHRKCQHAQTHYIHYAHTRASFTVAITHDLPVSTQFPVSKIRRAHDLRAHIYYQKHMATIETMSEARERIKAKFFIHAMHPLQLGMAICYQYESAYFSTPYADNQLLCSL